MSENVFPLNSFDQLKPRPTDPLLGREKPDARKVGQDKAWGNLGQIGVPPDLMSMLSRVKDCNAFPELHTYNDIFRELMYRGVKPILAEIEGGQHSWMVERYERIEKAASDNRWYDESLNMIEMRKKSLDNSKSTERTRKLIAECGKDLRTLHADVKDGMQDLIDDFSRRIGDG